jgi:hypothetical protein
MIRSGAAPITIEQNTVAEKQIVTTDDNGWGGLHNITTETTTNVYQ